MYAILDKIFCSHTVILPQILHFYSLSSALKLINSFSNFMKIHLGGSYTTK